MLFDFQGGLPNLTKNGQNTIVRTFSLVLLGFITTILLACIITNLYFATGRVVLSNESQFPADCTLTVAAQKYYVRNLSPSSQKVIWFEKTSIGEYSIRAALENRHILYTSLGRTNFEGPTRDKIHIHDTEISFESEHRL
jgi:hypothetical protein